MAASFEWNSPAGLKLVEQGQVLGNEGNMEGRRMYQRFLLTRDEPIGFFGTFYFHMGT
jgi:hypothetical protein